MINRENNICLKLDFEVREMIKNLKKISKKYYALQKRKNSELNVPSGAITKKVKDAFEKLFL